jgi:diadenosine tetraphosphate (Ap4A) HIT family hydrolase
MGWAPNWDERVAGIGCVACAEGRPDEIEPGRRIFAGTWSDAYLERHAVAPGYTLVFFRGRHVADPIQLTTDEAAGYALEVRRVALAVQRAFAPIKLNYLTLGNVLPHLHTHIVPRYRDDPDAGRPPRFMMEDALSPEISDRAYSAQLERLRAAVDAA